MTERLRLPLAIPTEPRSGELDKDSLLRNAFLDEDPNNTVYAVKRAGRTLKSSPSTTNRGIYFNPNQNKFFYINSSNLPIEVVL